MSRIILEVVLDCIFGAMSGCGIVAGAGHMCALKSGKGSWSCLGYGGNS